MEYTGNEDCAEDPGVVVSDEAGSAAFDVVSQGSSSDDGRVGTGMSVGAV